MDSGTVRGKSFRTVSSRLFNHDRHTLLTHENNSPYRRSARPIDATLS